MNHYEHYQYLQKLAEEAGATVRVAEFWSNGIQQVDHYSIRTDSRSMGPFSYEDARMYLRGRADALADKRRPYAKAGRLSAYRYLDAMRARQQAELERIGKAIE